MDRTSLTTKAHTETSASQFAADSAFQCHPCPFRQHDQSVELTTGQLVGALAFLRGCRAVRSDSQQPLRTGQPLLLVVTELAAAAANCLGFGNVECRHVFLHCVAVFACGVPVRDEVDGVGARYQRVVMITIAT